MPADAYRQRLLDEEHLRLLGLFHYVQGALTIVGGLFWLVYAAFFGFIMRLGLDEFDPGTMPMDRVALPQGVEDPTAIFQIFGLLFGGFALLFVLFGIAQVVSGRMLRQHRARTFSLVVGAISLLELVYGTVMGVCTLMVLTRESVKRLYEEDAADLPPAGDGYGHPETA